MKMFLLIFLFPALALANVPIRTQLMAQKSRDFGRWIQDLTHSNDPSTLTELMSLAKDPTLPEDRRYMAIMGVSRKASNQAMPWLQTLLEDPSFHVRSAALTSLAALSRADPQDSSKILQNSLGKALRDPALWIRLHALGLAEEFNLRVLRADVESILQDPRNRVHGESLPIVSKAKQVLETWQ